MTELVLQISHLSVKLNHIDILKGVVYLPVILSASEEMQGALWWRLGGNTRSTRLLIGGAKEKSVESRVHSKEQKSTKKRKYSASVERQGLSFVSFCYWYTYYWQIGRNIRAVINTSSLSLSYLTHMPCWVHDWCGQGQDNKAENGPTGTSSMSQTEGPSHVID